jgi:hypothetical protein
MGRDRSAGVRRQDRGRDAAFARGAGRVDELRSLRDRALIAQSAARLIVEHGLTDWTLARRKAARQLALPDSTPMPSNEDILQALTDHHALFGGEAHAASLRRQREEALAWMRRLAQWEPVLVGGVAAGWATEYSDVRLELVADDPKTVEIALAGSGVAYAAAPPREDVDRPDGVTQLRIAGADTALRLSILSPQQRRHRSRKDDEPRLTAEELAALLADG